MARNLNMVVYVIHEEMPVIKIIWWLFCLSILNFHLLLDVCTCVRAITHGVRAITHVWRKDCSFLPPCVLVVGGDHLYLLSPEPSAGPIW